MQRYSRKQACQQSAKSYATIACLSSAMLHVWTPKSQQTRPCSWWWTVMRAESHRQAGPDLRAVLVAPGSTLSRRMLMLSHFHLYGKLRFSGVTGWRNGLSGLREDDDDDYVLFGCCLVVISSAVNCLERPVPKGPVMCQVGRLTLHTHYCNISVALVLTVYIRGAQQAACGCGSRKLCLWPAWLATVLFKIDPFDVSGAHLFLVYGSL